MSHAIAEPYIAYDVDPTKKCWICNKPITDDAPAHRGAHVTCRERRESLLSSGDAADRLGLTSAQFLRLAKKLGIQPEGWYTNPHYRSGPECPLWPPEDVEALVGSPEVQEVIERSRKAIAARARKAGERRKTLAEKYPNWRDALAPAAEAMFNLNRYAKWQSCSPAHRREIYDLKNRFVRLLYQLGLATEVRRHTVRSETWYGKVKKLVYFAFRFQIGEQTYSWHQPAHLVSWKVEYTPGNVPQDWQPEWEKPVEMPARQFADAKALIGYVLEQAKKEESAKKSAEKAAE